jgi:hypothetical protein
MSSFSNNHESEQQESYAISIDSIRAAHERIRDFGMKTTLV